MISEENQVLDEVYKNLYTKAYTKGRIIWKNVLILSVHHTGLLAALIIYVFKLYSTPVHWLTVTWIFVAGYGSGIGITAGVHRLWTHRAYKSNLFLRILLMVMYSGVGMNNIFAWAREHRVHHKYSETDADPHDARRGFFFSHIGWLILTRHPEYIRRAREIDMTDLLADPVVTFQKKYETELKWIFCYIIPTAIPIVFWGETILHAVMTQCFIRRLWIHHCVWSVNSIAHLWGTRPYNRLINPAENTFVSIVSGGEGMHNYHHTFPWDYKASEFPYPNFNLTTIFIHGMAKLGWAYDLREPPPELVEKVICRIGYKSELKESY